jgi:hypothetical protein
VACTGPAGHRIELDLEVVAGDSTQTEGEQVEEEGAVLGGVQGDETVGARGVGDPVDLFQVGGLARLGRTVVDDLRFDGPFAEIELDHGEGLGRNALEVAGVRTGPTIARAILDGEPGGLRRRGDRSSTHDRVLVDPKPLTGGGWLLYFQFRSEAVEAYRVQALTRRQFDGSAMRHL